MPGFVSNFLCRSLSGIFRSGREIFVRCRDYDGKAVGVLSPLSVTPMHTGKSIRSQVSTVVVAPALARKPPTGRCSNGSDHCSVCGEILGHSRRWR